ncbi:MAG: DUF3798 domain-containing protein [Peptostreptococcaceae bacterium]|nr:DUF3798 domain-containing protein [Peptostreptococcaceae bacterium]
MKKLLAILMSAVLVFGMAGCGQKTETGDGGSSDGGNNQQEQGGETPTYKIGIMTGTVSQGEEEFRAAEALKAEYGDMIITTTYPDSFMKETETTIANFMTMASDPDVKAIVVCQAVPGISAAIEKARELRGEDLLIIAGTPGEDPDMIASKADLVLVADELGMGTTIIEEAVKMGAKTFVHYSFPRHMSYQMLSARRDILKKTAEEKGIVFVDATAPDPTGDAGVPGTQQFILEDIPRKVAEYGTETAFFGTNCAMQEPMIKSVVQQKALYPQQCCPSPFHGYPGAFGIEVPEGKQGDVPFMVEQIQAKVAEAGMTGRMATWPVPVNMLFVKGGVEYARAYIEGEFTEKVNADKLKAIFADAGADVQLTNYKNEATDKLYENYFMVLSSYVVF